MTSAKETGGQGTLRTSLTLVARPDHIPHFFPLLQGGFLVEARVGCSISTFLSEQMGVSPQYVKERILSIFLDGKPVDDPDSAIIRDGSSLALSATMPGLVGVTLRRGSALASFRSSITHRESDHAGPEEEGRVSIKLFNLVMKELGPLFLERGIYVEPSILKGYMEDYPDFFTKACRRALINGKPVEPHKLPKNLPMKEELLLLYVLVPDEKS